MDGYIERETILDAISEQRRFYLHERDGETNMEKLYLLWGSDNALTTMEDIMSDIPAADVAPVVHGRWLPEDHKDKVSQTEYHSYIWYHCSECGRRLIGYRDPWEAPYCHCGAKMDLED